jgi:hypothetical protein
VNRATSDSDDSPDEIGQTRPEQRGERQPGNGTKFSEKIRPNPRVHRARFRATARGRPGVPNQAPGSAVARSRFQYHLAGAGAVKPGEAESAVGAASSGFSDDHGLRREARAPLGCGARQDGPMSLTAKGSQSVWRPFSARRSFVTPKTLLNRSVINGQGSEAR